MKVLEVHLRDAGAERANPVLRVSIEDDVADVEVRLQPWGIELVDVAGEFERTQQELVPDLLDGDDHSQLARDGQYPLSNDLLGPRPGVSVRRSLIDDSRYEQHSVGAPPRRVTQRGFQPCDASIHDVAIPARQREAPVIDVHHGMNSQAGLVGRVANLRSLFLTGDRLHLDRVESRLARDCEALSVGGIFREHGDEDGFLGAKRRLQRWQQCRGCSRLQKRPAIHHASPARRRSFRKSMVRHANARIDHVVFCVPPHTNGAASAM